MKNVDNCHFGVGCVHNNVFTQYAYCTQKRQIRRRSAEKPRKNEQKGKPEVCLMLEKTVLLEFCQILTEKEPFPMRKAYRAILKHHFYNALIHARDDAQI